MTPDDAATLDLEAGLADLLRDMALDALEDELHARLRAWNPTLADQIAKIDGYVITMKDGAEYRACMDIIGISLLPLDEWRRNRLPQVSR